MVMGMHIGLFSLLEEGRNPEEGKEREEAGKI